MRLSVFDVTDTTHQISDTCFMINTTLFSIRERSREKLNDTIRFPRTDTIHQLIDTTVIYLNLDYPNPKFTFHNSKISNGVFLCVVSEEEESYSVRTAFKNFQPDGIWIAEDTCGVIRLNALYDEGEIKKIKLYNEKGGLLRLLEYINGEIQYEEWYNDGKLTQKKQKTTEGFLLTSFHDNYHKHMEFFLNSNNRTIKIVHYNEEGQVILIDTPDSR
jgi:hypothetical protein